MQLATSLLEYLSDPASIRNDSNGTTKRKSNTNPIALTTVADTTQVSKSLLWGVAPLATEIDNAFENLQSTSELLRLTQKVKPGIKRAASAVRLSEAIARWLNTHLPNDGSDQFVALVATGWIYTMRHATTTLSSSLWLETLQNVLTQVDRAWSEENGDSLIPTLLWGCEIPLALATQIDRIDGRSKLVSETRQRLQFLTTNIANAKTLWLKQGGCETRALLASFVRCNTLFARMNSKSISKKQVKQLQKYVRAALSLSQHDGQPLLQDGVLSNDDSLWRAVAAVWPGDKKLDALIALIVPQKPCKMVSKKAKRKMSEFGLEASLPPLGQHFVDSEAVVMRRKWSRGSQLVAVDYSVDPLWLEIYGRDQRPLLRGGWDLELTCDGVEMLIDTSWHELCWLSDDGIHYLELQCEVEGRCKIQRQIMLVQSEAVVYLCDTLLADQPGRWELKSTIPLADGIAAFDRSQNTELDLRQRAAYTDKESAIEAYVLPIALPEWKRSVSAGRLNLTDCGIALIQSILGDRMVCPLVICIGEKVHKSAYTWRQLTIADELKIQPQSEAVGFRVQIGDDQLLFYRSLGELRRRTMIGLHLLTEFYAGRFDSRDGDIETLIEVSEDDA